MSALREIAGDIKIAHSVFALPFAVLAAFMAAAPGGVSSVQWPRFTSQLVLVVAAMVLARTAAMLANRLVDRDIDGRNPRTQGRALPSGRLTTRAAVAGWCLAAAGFLLVCVGFGLLHGNWWPAGLGPAVLVWICAYPLLKRWTALCHVYLGSSLALSPLAAALAVEPAALTSQPSLWLLSVMVLFWVAGFDVIYALQDEAVDRREGLHSIPARLGPRGAVWASRGLHAVAAAALLGTFVVDPRLRVPFAIAAALVGGLLLYEHATVARWGTTKLALAFFTINGAISCVLGGLGIVDVLW